jgi:Flp pilus assembly protein TadD
MKKLLTILFASMVIFSLAMPVFADEAAPATTKKEKKTKAPKTKKTKKTEETKAAQ